MVGGAAGEGSGRTDNNDTFEENPNTSEGSDLRGFGGCPSLYQKDFLQLSVTARVNIFDDVLKLFIPKVLLNTERLSKGRDEVSVPSQPRSLSARKHSGHTSIEWIFRLYSDFGSRDPCHFLIRERTTAVGVRRHLKRLLTLVVRILC